MHRAVLCVDDEPNTLVAYRRFLASRCTITTVSSGEAALAAMATVGPFAVVLADFQMPHMDGVTFLAAARSKYPDTVRMLVTGDTDLAHAIDAVNTGQVFQFLTKPCAPATLVAAVSAALAQHELILSDRRRVNEELRASEERYRQLFDANPYPMWVHDAETKRFLAVNEAAVAQYGYSRSEFLARTVLDLSPDAHVDPPPGTRGPGAPCRHRHASGAIRQVELAASPIVFGGRPAQLVLIVDVTERIVLEEQLKQAQKLESIGQLAAGIAHEINTPIQYIGDNTNFIGDSFRDLSGVLSAYRAARGDPAALGAADAAAADADLDYLLEETPRALEQTREGVKHVTRIVKAMKEFAHPGTIDKSPIDLNRALETVATVTRNEWKYVAELVTRLDPDLPPVRGLPGELNQVFLNLLVNAAHAVAPAADAPAGPKGVITITTRQFGNVAEVRIADSGCGIPENIRERVFDPFFTTKPVGQGTGQGLAIAHAVVVKQHGGALSFESAAGKGTTFIVHLPIDGNRLTTSERRGAANISRSPVTPGEGG